MALVLLVEDDPDQLELRRMLLERAGHDVRSAADPDGALKTALEESPDAVIMDLALPRVADGVALLRSLRALVPEASVFVLSGSAGALQDIEECGHAKAVLTKPVPTARLLALIEAIGRS